jgi:hypothetical protein
MKVSDTESILPENDFGKQPIQRVCNSHFIVLFVDGGSVCDNVALS